jgi:hypothetical protein
MNEWDQYLKQLPQLESGAHEEGSGSLCAMEMVAYMEREPHSDAPKCTCPVLASYVRTLNDNMSDGEWSHPEIDFPPRKFRITIEEIVDE